MKKEIIIRNETDLKKFYNKLFIYKSFFYFFTTFEVINNLNNDLIDSIIKALNVKNKRKRITFIYDYVCDYADNYYVCKNICGFKNNQCYIQQKLKQKKINGCCRFCIYITAKGCSTKNFACKMFNCSAVREKNRAIYYNDFKILKCLSYRQQILLKADYFSKREDVLQDLFIGSLFIGTIRIFYRLLKKFYYSIYAGKSSFR